MFYNGGASHQLALAAQDLPLRAQMVIEFKMRIVSLDNVAAPRAYIHLRTASATNGPQGFGKAPGRSGARILAIDRCGILIEWLARCQLRSPELQLAESSRLQEAARFEGRRKRDVRISTFTRLCFESGLNEYATSIPRKRTGRWRRRHPPSGDWRDNGRSRRCHFPINSGNSGEIR